MKKFILALVCAVLAVVALSGVAFAMHRAISTTTFYACEVVTSATSPVGSIDPVSITQDDTMSCPVANGDQDATLKVTWNAVGLPGTNGTDGLPGATGPIGLTGPGGPTGPQGLSGLPFSHAACTEVLTGIAQQENAAFCLSGIEPDGGVVYAAAVGAALHRVLVGTPIASFPSSDWSNAAITYVEFTSGYHAEYHADNVVRIYNNLNQRVF